MSIRCRFDVSNRRRIDDLNLISSISNRRRYVQRRFDEDSTSNPHRIDKDSIRVRCRFDEDFDENFDVESTRIRCRFDKDSTSIRREFNVDSIRF